GNGTFVAHFDEVAKDRQARPLGERSECGKYRVFFHISIIIEILNFVNDRDSLVCAGVREPLLLKNEEGADATLHASPDLAKGTFARGIVGEFLYSVSAHESIRTRVRIDA
ncbi:unnamed protein product, partial [marine sediment metagenome]